MFSSYAQYIFSNSSVHYDQDTMLLQDSKSSFPLSKSLGEADSILLLTPGIAPGPPPPLVLAANNTAASSSSSRSSSSRSSRSSSSSSSQAIAPVSSSSSSSPPPRGGDPFEPLGRALARHHPCIRHVPYLPRNGITGTHVVHIQLAALVVFVISSPLRVGDRSQVDWAEIALAVSEHRPFVLMTSCSLRALGSLQEQYPTIVEIPGYAPTWLEAAADLMFGRGGGGAADDGLLMLEAASGGGIGGDGEVLISSSFSSLPSPESSSLSSSSSRRSVSGSNFVAPSSPRVSGEEGREKEEEDEEGDEKEEADNKEDTVITPSAWSVEVWDKFLDIEEVWTVWRRCLPRQFTRRLSPFRLKSILQRDGWVKHYVVREAPGRGAILGFCATYTGYVDGCSDERLVGSLAALLVLPEHRGRGVGSSLHRFATRELARTRGVCRLQLGSSFPRLLYGLPVVEEGEGEGAFCCEGDRIGDEGGGGGGGPGGDGGEQEDEEETVAAAAAAAAACSHAEAWFRRRGWTINNPVKSKHPGERISTGKATGGGGGSRSRMAGKPDSERPGTGQEASDWFLRFEDWPAGIADNGSGSGGSGSRLTFRSCEPGEFDQVMKLIGAESSQRPDDMVGWYDEYAKLASYPLNIQDIIVGVDGGGDGSAPGGRIFATALTYAPMTGSPVFEDMPWAGTLGGNVGGVTCICISDADAALGNKRDNIMIRLLDSCVRLLASQGASKLFVDAIKGGTEGFQALGFQKWARYKEVWREV